MADHNTPKWMEEVGRRAAPRQVGRPVPAIGNITVASELDEAKASRLEADYRKAIEDCQPDGVDDLNARILDAMTGNRLSSAQAYRLLLALFTKGSDTPGLSTVSRAGDLVPMNMEGF